MLFFVYHVDRPNSGELRRATRGAHLEYVKAFNLLLGGPTLADDGETMTGSVIIIDAPDRAAADEFVRNDPYVQAGLFESSTVKAWKKVLP